jgi:hypothetical protein
MTATRTRVATGHVPRPQQKLLHAAPGRFKVLVTHRRFGKTVFAVNELISGARRCRLPQPHFAYLAPFHVQAKDVAWSYLKHYTAKIPDVTVSESELWVELPPRIEHDGATGARIRLYGADNADRLRGLYFDGVVLDEYAQMHPRVWSEVVRPALADRMGWALFIGTPMGRNGFCELYEGARDGFALADGARRRDPDWAGFMFKASETGIIPAAELEAAQRIMTPDQYAQEFECSFDAAIPGAYYAQVLNEADQLGRIRPIAHEPALPVHTGWDLGIGDPLPADTLEGGFDRAVMRDLQLKDAQDRALTFPVTIAPGVSAELPNPSADTYLGWNATGDALENKNLPGGAAVYASIANTRAGTTTTEAVTPDALASMWQKGSALTAAATIAKPTDANLGGVYTVNGNTTTDNFWAGDRDGEVMEHRYSGTPNLSIAGNLLPPNSAACQIVAGDMLRWRWEGGLSKWRAYSGMHADGSPFRILSARGSAGQVLTSNGAGAEPSMQDPAGPIVRGTTGTINNGTATSFTPPTNAGKIMFATPGTGPQFQGEAYYYVGIMLAGTVGANFTVNTTDGTLTGTTGTVGNITIRGNSADGKIYVENRTGLARNLTYYITA